MDELSPTLEGVQQKKMQEFLPDVQHVTGRGETLASPLCGSVDLVIAIAAPFLTLTQ